MNPRDHFAMHAPPQPVWWMQQSPLSVPPVLTNAQAVDAAALSLGVHPSDDQRRRIADWLHDPVYDLDDADRALGKAAEKAYDDSKQRHNLAWRERELERDIAWRWFWADRMVMARERRRMVEVQRQLAAPASPPPEWGMTS
jgi:hypothetical protein